MNQQLITLFIQLREQAKSDNDSAKAFRINTYNKVIKYLESYPYDIKTIDDVNNFAQSHEGIGKKTITRMIEYIQTGNMTDVIPMSTPLQEHMKYFNVSEPIAQQIISAGYTDPTKVPSMILEYIQVTNLFKEVYGVGSVNADKWYYQGYRKLSDIPQNELTRSQQIGIKYVNDFKQQIPRSEIASLDTYLKQIQGLTFEICGSYRRGLSTSGDIDIIILDIPNFDIVQFLTSLPFIMKDDILAQGSKKINAVALIDKIYRRIDFEIVQQEEYPFALLYFTGPKEFNIALRDRARKMNWKLNEKGLTLTNGELLLQKSEKEIMMTLGFPYYTPQERQELYS